MATSIAKSIRRQIIKRIKGVPRDKAMLKTIALRSLLNIRTRVRKGFGVEMSEGKKKRLKKLEKKTKKNRRLLSKQGRLADTATPNKSNFTRSGDTLRNLENLG